MEMLQDRCCVQAMDGCRETYERSSGACCKDPPPIACAKFVESALGRGCVFGNPAVLLVMGIPIPQLDPLPAERQVVSPNSVGRSISV